MPSTCKQMCVCVFTEDMFKGGGKAKCQNSSQLKCAEMFSVLRGIEMIQSRVGSSHTSVSSRMKQAT